MRPNQYTREFLKNTIEDLLDREKTVTEIKNELKEKFDIDISRFWLIERLKEMVKDSRIKKFSRVSKSEGWRGLLVKSYYCKVAIEQMRDPAVEEYLNDVRM
jgi:hypothetical protein